MNAAYFRRMIDYTFWEHRQVWGCVLALSEDLYCRPCDYSIGSVHEQVVHTMGAEWLWLQRVRDEAPDSFLRADDFADRDAVRTRWDEIESGWRAFVDVLKDEQLEQPVRYFAMTDKSWHEQPLWEGLAQIVNHATDHRAQILALIHQVGGKTMAQDFIYYTWQQPSV